MVRSKRIAIIAFVVLAVAAALSTRLPRGGESEVAAAPTTTTTASTTTTTTKPPVKTFEGADAAVPSVDLYDTPDDTAAPVDSMANPTWEHVPLAFAVLEHGPPGWLHVRVSRRPNGSTAWIRADQVILRPVPNRIVIEREARQLTVYQGTSDNILLQTAVADGAPATPTPLGDFFVDVVVKITNTSGAYGPYQLSVSGFSDVLQSFGGGIGQMAIHGTNHPELIGQFVSNGCVRVTNDDITAMADLAPVGTPVQIVE